MLPMRCVAIGRPKLLSEPFSRRGYPTFYSFAMRLAWLLPHGDKQVGGMSADINHPLQFRLGRPVGNDGSSAFHNRLDREHMHGSLIAIEPKVMHPYQRLVDLLSVFRCEVMDREASHNVQPVLTIWNDRGGIDHEHFKIMVVDPIPTTIATGFLWLFAVVKDFLAHILFNLAVAFVILQHIMIRHEYIFDLFACALCHRLYFAPGADSGNAWYPSFDLNAAPNRHATGF